MHVSTDGVALVAVPTVHPAVAAATHVAGEVALRTKPLTQLVHVSTDGEALVAVPCLQLAAEATHEAGEVALRT